MSTPNFIYDITLLTIKIIFKNECGVSAASAGEHRELVIPASSPSLFYDETFALSAH